MDHSGLPTTVDQIDEFAARYFDDYGIQSAGTRAERVAAEGSAMDRVGWVLDQAIRSGSVGAENAWPLITELVERAPTAEARAFVAAGPLEDLVRTHADRFGDRLIERARASAPFREALRGVWGWEDVTEPLRTRLLETIAGP